VPSLVLHFLVKQEAQQDVSSSFGWPCSIGVGLRRGCSGITCRTAALVLFVLSWKTCSLVYSTEWCGPGYYAQPGSRISLRPLNRRGQTGGWMVAKEFTKSIGKALIRWSSSLPGPYGMSETTGSSTMQ
jgi:hypothetical protein